MEHPPILVIGINGDKGHGKDTLAKIILDSYPEYKSKRIAFADPLKKEVATILRIPLLFIVSERRVLQWIEDNKSNRKWVRKLLQIWGTEVRRNLYGQYYWISKFLNEINNARCEGCRLIVVPDMRFKNEFTCIRGMLNGKTIKVVRGGLANKDSHISENDIRDMQFDFTVHNDGTLDEFKRNMTRFSYKVLGQYLPFPYNLH